MILLPVLITIAILLTVFVVFGISIFGALGFIVFGDVIVCIVLIISLVRWIIKKRK